MACYTLGVEKKKRKRKDYAFWRTGNDFVMSECDVSVGVCEYEWVYGLASGPSRSQAILIKTVAALAS